jgi:hypothetical protein
LLALAWLVKPGRCDGVPVVSGVPDPLRRISVTKKTAVEIWRGVSTGVAGTILAGTLVRAT